QVSVSGVDVVESRNFLNGKRGDIFRSATSEESSSQHECCSRTCDDSGLLQDDDLVCLDGVHESLNVHWGFLSRVTGSHYMTCYSCESIFSSSSFKRFTAC